MVIGRNLCSVFEKTCSKLPRIYGHLFINFNSKFDTVSWFMIWPSDERYPWCLPFLSVFTGTMWSGYSVWFEKTIWTNRFVKFVQIRLWKCLLFLLICLVWTAIVDISCTITGTCSVRNTLQATLWKFRCWIKDSGWKGIDKFYRISKLFTKMSVCAWAWNCKYVLAI